jgi:hypothetical protein
VFLQAIPRTLSLENLTRDRPKPPSQRRPPSKFRTPTPSPVHTSQTGYTGLVTSSSSPTHTHSSLPAHISQGDYVSTSQTGQAGAPASPVQSGQVSPFQRSAGTLVERIGGITNTVQENGNQPQDVTDDGGANFKEQWVSGQCISYAYQRELWDK